MKKIIIILLLSFLFPEKLIYSLGFRFINVGQATITSNFDSNNQLIIHTIISSNKFVDRLYKVRDDVKLIVNPNDYSLKRIEKDVLEGTWERHYVADIDTNLNIVTKDKIIENDKLLFDPISVIYNLRSKELKTGNKYEYNILGIDEIQPLTTEVGNIEQVKVPSGKYQCIKVIPYSNDDKNIFKENGYMTAWFSNDNQKIPVKIELKTNIGNMTLKLKKIIP